MLKLKRKSQLAINFIFAFIFIITSFMTFGGVGNAYATEEPNTVFSNATISMTLDDLALEDDDSIVLDTICNIANIKPKYDGNVLDVAASCYDCLYQYRDDLCYIAHSADVTIHLNGRFNYDSNSTIKYEGNSDVYDLTLVLENGTEVVGNISYETDLLELNRVENIKAIKIHFGRAVDTLCYGKLSIITDTYNYINYTSPIDDLKKDTSFNIEDYPENSEDYSVNVIQIAESERGYLYIYTYQPYLKLKNLPATDINMSLTESAENNKLYSLTLINTSGVFAKYLVNNVQIDFGGTRYYNISSIYRDWDKDFDGETGTDNIAIKKSFSVAKLYKVTTENRQSNYFLSPTYVVQIKDLYSDYLIYEDSASCPVPLPSLGLSFLKFRMIDSHYIAFNTDIEIEKLKAVTVIYNCRSGKSECNALFLSPIGTEKTYGTEQTRYAYPTYLDKVENKGNIWGTNYKYSWDRIQTAKEFVETENLSDETKQIVSQRQWVIRFLETERTLNNNNVVIYNQFITTFTDVNKVNVIYLEYETGGKTYKVGTVSDVVSDDDKPGNPLSQKTNFFKYVWDCIVKLFTGKANVIEAIVAIIAILFCVIVLAVVIKFIRWIIKNKKY